MPLISIIVPVYNAEKTLKRCVDSILAQTFTNFELLLVDDGSKDDSGAICEDYTQVDSRVKAFHKNNGGVSSARNLGLDVSQGEYITFADSDDEVFAEWLSCFVSSTKEYGPSNALLIEGVEWWRHSADGQVVECCANKQSQVISLETLFAHNNMWGCCCNKLFCSSVIKDFDIRFDESLRYCEDCPFVATYASHVNDVKVIDYVGYRYYGPDSYADKYSEMKSLDAIFEYYSKIKMVNPLCFRELADGFFMFFLSKYKDIGDKRGALRLFREIIGADISFVKGRKKMLIRQLAHVNNAVVWRLVIMVSSIWI